MAVGSYSYDNNRETEIYTFKTNQWRSVQKFPYGSSYFYGISAVFVKGYFYTFGGYTGAYLNNIERLDPIQGKFVLKSKFLTFIRTLVKCWLSKFCSLLQRFNSYWRPSSHYRRRRINDDREVLTYKQHFQMYESSS